MSRNTEELGGLSLLGNQHTEYRADYAPEVLEAFPNNSYRLLDLNEIQRDM